MSDPGATSPLAPRVAEEQLRAHYALVPAMVVAPTAGGLYTAWVLWDAEPRAALVVGVAALVALGAARLALWTWYRRSPVQGGGAHWRVLAVAAALLSGLLWGSAALVLYPPRQHGYEVFVLVLLALVPVIPVAALASYLPAFYAYSLTCAAPFIAVLATSGSRAERATAVLLVMMMVAMLTFARRYAATLRDAITLKLQLAEKTRVLEDTMRQRSRLVAAASHDLREPVHAMSLFLASLHGSTAVGAATVVDHIERSLGPLQSMLADLLDIARLDAQTLGVHRRPVAAGPLLSRLHAEYAPQAERRGLGLRLRVHDLRLDTDPLLLERLLRNLLSNALKYTERGGVVLACRRHGALARLQVVDTGRGIASADLQRALAAFGQTEWPAQGGGRSAGLGLAIVQRLADLLGHRLDVTSRPGRGTRFALAVPTTEAPEPGPEAPLDGTPSRVVLVIDDDAPVAEATARLLRSWGHAVDVAHSAGQAQARLAAGPLPDLLIVDETLPDGVSGLALLQALRLQAGQALPAVIVSGDGSPLLVRRAYDAACPLLLKPVAAAQLAACVARLTSTP